MKKRQQAQEGISLDDMKVEIRMMGKGTSLACLPMENRLV